MFYIYLTTPIQYASINAKGVLKDKGVVESFDELTGIAAKETCIGIVPGEWVSIRSAELPTRSERKTRLALPMALEEGIIDDIDTLFFVPLGPTNTTTKYSMVVDRKYLEQWLGDASDAGLKVEGLYPDYAWMPQHSDADHSVLFDGADNVFISSQEFVRRKVKHSQVKFWWREIASTQCTVANNSDTFPTMLDAEEDIKVVRWQPEVDWSVWLQNRNARIEPYNLLQKEFTPAHKASKFRAVKLAAAIVLMAGVIQVANDGYVYAKLINENKQLDQNIRALFTTYFPEVKRIVNPRVQLQNAIAALSNGSSDRGEFPILLTEVAAVARANAVKIEEMSYRDNALVFTGLFSNFSMLDQFEKRLKASEAIDVKLQRSGAINSNVSGRFSIMLRQP